MNTTTKTIEKLNSKTKFNLGAIAMLVYVIFSLLLMFTCFILDAIAAFDMELSFSDTIDMLFGASKSGALICLVAWAVFAVFLLMKKSGIILVFPIGAVVLVNLLNGFGNIIDCIKSLIGQSLDITGYLTSLSSGLFALGVLVALVALILAHNKIAFFPAAKKIFVILFFVFLGINLLDVFVSNTNSVISFFSNFEYIVVDNIDYGSWYWALESILVVFNINDYIHILALFLIGFWLINPYKKSKQTNATVATETEKTEEKTEA